MSVETTTCFKCWADTAQLTYEENRLYKVSCSCGCEYTFNHCSLNDALSYHLKMLELYAEMDKNEAANAKIAELQEKYDRLNDFDNTQLAESELKEYRKAGNDNQWIELASDNTEYVLAYADGLYCVTDAYGRIVCEFIKTKEAAEKAIAEKGGQNGNEKTVCKPGCL